MNVTTGDLAKVVAVGPRGIKSNIGKIVVVGDKAYWPDGPYWRCTSLSGPFYAERYQLHDDRPTGVYGDFMVCDFPDKHLRRIDPPETPTEIIHSLTEKL